MDGPKDDFATLGFGCGPEDVKEEVGAAFETGLGCGEVGEFVGEEVDPAPDGAADDDGDEELGAFH